MRDRWEILKLHCKSEIRNFKLDKGLLLKSRFKETLFVQFEISKFRICNICNAGFVQFQNFLSVPYFLRTLPALMENEHQ